LAHAAVRGGRRPGRVDTPGRVSGAWEYEAFVAKRIDAYWLRKGLVGVRAAAGAPTLVREMLCYYGWRAALRWEWLRGALQLLNCIQQQRELRQSVSGSVILIEEGALQMFSPLTRQSSAPITGPPELLIASLGSACVDAAVYVDCPDAVVTRRRSERNRSMRLPETVHKTPAQTAGPSQADSIYRSLLPAIRNAGIPMLEVNSAEPLQFNTRLVLEFLARLA